MDRPDDQGPTYEPLEPVPGSRLLSERPRAVQEVVEGTAAIVARPTPSAERGRSSLEVTRLLALVRRLEDRLAAVGRPQAGLEFHSRAVAPVFGELRNQLTPLVINAVELRTLGEELRLATRRSRRGGPLALELLQDALGALDDLALLAEELHGAVHGLTAGIEALEHATTGRTIGAPPILRDAAQLALHRTKLIGEVRLPAPTLGRALAVSDGVAVSITSVVLQGIAAEASRADVRGPIDVRLPEARGPQVHIRFIFPGLDTSAFERIARDVTALVGLGPGVGVEAEADGLRVRLPAAVNRTSAPDQLHGGRGRVGE